MEIPANRDADSIYSADLIHGRAMALLEGMDPQQPFFLFLSYTLPHAALSVPHDSVYDRYVRAFGEKPLARDAVKQYEKAAFEPYPHAAYAAMVSRLDKYVGQIVRAVAARGMSERTLIIFSSDNGPHREGGNDPDFFASSGGYRGIKRDLYEGGIRVPFIANWKGHIQPGRTSDYAGAFWDLFPTFQEISGGGRVTGLDGISLAPLLAGKVREQRAHAYLYWEFHENDGRQAVRMGEWKGVRLRVSKEKDAPIELYDLSRDPLERQNVAAAHPEVVRRMAVVMGEAHRPDKNWPLLVGE